jgi:hypothetical protein
VADTEARPGCGWADWDWHLESEPVAAERPPLRLLLILDLFRCRDYADSGAARARNVAFNRLSQNELSGRTGVDEHKLAGFFLIYRDLQALTTDVSEA